MNTYYYIGTANPHKLSEIEAEDRSDALHCLHALGVQYFALYDERELAQRRQVKLSRGSQPMTHRQPWIDRFNKDYLEQTTTDEEACLKAGKMIKDWFNKNQEAKSLLIERDAFGVPQIVTGNKKSLSTTFNK